MTKPNPALSADELDALRQAILAEIDRLERSMLKTEKDLSPIALDQTAVGRLSRIDALQNQGLLKNLSERQQVKLAQLAEALRRMERGTYGVCVECGSPIGHDRLVIFPEAATCVACTA